MSDTSILIRTAVSALTFICAGCAQFNPYVAPDQKLLFQATESRDVMNESLNYALAQTNAWRSKANQISNTQNALYAVALPASAVAAYYAITGDRGNSAITALTGVSASSYSLSLLSQSRPRQSVYLAGTQAMSCVIWSAAPLAMPAEQVKLVAESTMKLSNSVTIVLEKLDKLQMAITSASSIKDLGTEEKNKLQAAKLYLSSVDEVANSAPQSISRAYSLLAAINEAGVKVGARVIAIESEVNMQILAQEPKPEAILQVATEFSSNLRLLRDSLGSSGDLSEGAPKSSIEETAGEADNIDGSKSDELAQLKRAMTEITSSVKDLQNSVSRLKTIKLTVDAIVDGHADAMKVADEVAKCKVEGRSSQISIFPSAKSIKMNPGSKYNFNIKGGSGFFNVEAVGTNVEGTKISRANTAFSGRAPIIEFAESATGKQTIIVSDINDEHVTPVEITFLFEAISGVNEEQSKNDGESESDPITHVLSGGEIDETGAFINDRENCSIDDSEARVNVVQSAIVGVKLRSSNFIDSKWGSNTKSGLKEYLDLRFGLNVSEEESACALANQLAKTKVNRFFFYRDATKGSGNFSNYQDVDRIWNGLL